MLATDIAFCTSLRFQLLSADKLFAIHASLKMMLQFGDQTGRQSYKDAIVLSYLHLLLLSDFSRGGCASNDKMLFRIAAINDSLKRLD
jgi:hypothetical protein